MALKEILNKYKKLDDSKNEPDWELYKKKWQDSIKHLQHLFMFKWFNEYETEGLMTFQILPTKRLDSYLGEYITSNLEITLSGNKYLMLEPISGITSEYDGKLEFYMLGNVYHKVTILRNLLENGSEEWILATSYDKNTHVKLDKLLLEKLIEKWLK
jgi:hypothetical protein